MFNQSAKEMRNTITEYFKAVLVVAQDIKTSVNVFIEIKEIL